MGGTLFNSQNWYTFIFPLTLGALCAFVVHLIKEHKDEIIEAWQKHFGKR